MDDSNLYAEESRPQFKNATDILERHKSQIPWGENERVLDIGCGPGHTTAQLIVPLTPPSTFVLGCDISKNMVDFARRHFESENLQFTNVDIGADNVTTKLGKEGFDKIFSFYCLHWIQDQRKVSENVWNLLKPNGYAFLVFMSSTQINPLYNIVGKEPRWMDYMPDADKHRIPYQNIENPSEVHKELLESIGFKVFDCYTKEFSLDSLNLDSLRKIVEAVNPFVGKMPVELRSEYIDYLMKTVSDKGLIKAEKTGNQETLAITANRMLIVFCQKPKK